MESLSEEIWDVVIAGTSLPQSLLALALSKCDLKVLHLDENPFYGGSSAGLSLDEAQKWIDHLKEQDTSISSKFSIEIPESSSAELRPSRNYTISLNPQIIYAKSSFLPTLVSSQVHTQLEFQAVGSFFICEGSTLQKIPSNREDVFADATLSVRDKRRLMALLRYVMDDQEESSEASPVPTSPSLKEKLEDQFKIPSHLTGAVQALTLSSNAIENTQFDTAMLRLKRHLSSIGYFGPGIAAVMAKYGGNAEIAQVACRAGAVGGFVYLLGHSVQSATSESEDKTKLDVLLSNGIKVQTRCLISSAKSTMPEPAVYATHQTSIVSKPLRHLFNPTTEGAPVPAVAIILVKDNKPESPPVYLQVHSEDTGEAPAGQCIIHATTLDFDATALTRLEAAVESILSTIPETDVDQEPARVIWKMTFTRENAPSESRQQNRQFLDGRIIVLPRSKHDVAFDDTILDCVKNAWESVLGEQSKEYDFLRFEERKDEEDEDV